MVVMTLFQKHWGREKNKLDKKIMKDSQSILIASILSLLFLLGWEYFVAKPQRIDNEQDDMPKGIEVVEYDTDTGVSDSVAQDVELYEEGPQLLINGGAVEGSLDLKGLKLNRLILKDYDRELGDDEHVELFIPKLDESAYYAEFGFLSSDSNLILPDNNTVWQANKQSLKAGDTVTLTWVNPQNVLFQMEISLDEKYMFHMKHSVTNNSDRSIKYNNYALITRTHNEVSRKNMMVHEGAIGVLDDQLKEYSFKEIGKKGKLSIQDAKGWIGFSDKYWLSALIPQGGKFNGKFARYYNQSTDEERFQADYVSKGMVLKPGQSGSFESLLFAGAKELKTIEHYKSMYNIPLFDRSVDFGLLYFITKPIFLLLNYFYGLLHNFGYAIIALTIFIKVLLFPLAYKGFKGMNRLKDLQPKMASLKERYKDKPQEFQRAMMDLYKKEKVNPMSGCLPLLLQMPVFFALYKVLYVNIEMRQAYFFGWIKDLSAPDPTSIFTLFGLVPLALPSFLQIGVFPMLMALSMYVQQKLSPQPTDATQAKMMKFLPLIFLFMFASFPSGLVIYITVSNALSIGQQVAIRKILK